MEYNSIQTAGEGKQAMQDGRALETLAELKSKYDSVRIVRRGADSAIWISFKDEIAPKIFGVFGTFIGSTFPVPVETLREFKDQCHLIICDMKNRAVSDLKFVEGTFDPWRRWIIYLRSRSIRSATLKYWQGWICFVSPGTRHTFCAWLRQCFIFGKRK